MEHIVYVFIINAGEGANVAFTAYLGHIMHNMQDKQKLVFEKVVTNEGGFYNNTTGNGKTCFIVLAHLSRRFKKICPQPQAIYIGY